VLRRILKDVRNNAYASIQDELDYGIVSVAVPILGPDGEILAAINCSTATSRITEEDMIEARLPQLRNAARKIEAELNRYPILIHSIRSAAD
jgi:IclR family pca regulon transcriptional regulator